MTGGLRGCCVVRRDEAGLNTGWSLATLAGAGAVQGGAQRGESWSQEKEETEWGVDTCARRVAEWGEGREGCWREML